ncbi:DUF2501 domain-containing protein [Rhodopila sp.]|uniref:DUF2501 domain-containing protein n=1 Tax=Rhodopila sp. TaxID=2480087 RepID=UPI003D09EF93
MIGFTRHISSAARVSSAARTTGMLGVIALAVLLVPQAPASAHLLDKLKGAVGGSGQDSGGAGGIGGGAMPSVGQVSPSNTAGVLQYCVKNNYVSGGNAASVKDSLMSKVTGSGSPTSDSGYQAGNKGVLDTGNGQNYSLGGGGIKGQITQKVCDQILQHAKSLL